MDDTPANLLALQAVLRREGYVLRTARSWLEAIRQVEEHDFAVVLLDVHMPEMDGFETAARLAGIAREGGPVPIIFVTGVDADPSRILRGYAVEDAIRGAMESIAPAADAKGVAIRSDLDPSLAITADPDRLQQVVWNILANAVKFTPKGGDVSAHAYREGSMACIAITDTGEGMAADVVPHVFEAFCQGDPSTTRRHGGLGLGLAIVKQLAAAHGGTVEARSEGPGRGAAFVVRLPARGAVPVFHRSPATEAPTMAVAAGPHPRLDGLSVLVVDDEEDARTVVDQVLREQGASVVTASSAMEALVALPSGIPDVIVSDIAMPEMDGYTFMRKVRMLSRSKGGRTPAVALTAYVGREDAQRAFAAGFQMHVPKPVEPMQLVRVVANVAGRTLGEA